MQVYYDQNDGHYYRINKETGQQVKSFKNGSQLTKFKCQYSGSNILNRKILQPDFSPKILKKNPFSVHYDHKHTIPLKSIRKNSHHSSQNRKIQISQTIYFSPKERQSNLLIKDNKFARKLKQYSEINRSPDIQQTIQSEQELPIIKQSAHKRKRNHKNKQNFCHLPEILSIKHQTKKEAAIFLEYNSKYLPKINKKSENELKERQKNLKILEELQLSNTLKITNKIYQE